MTVAELLALVRTNTNPDPTILKDDGTYHIQEERDDTGLLLRVCDVALLEEDDAECHGGFYRRPDGVWTIAFCTRIESEPDNLQSLTAEVDNKEHAISVLWEMRHATCGYRTGRSHDSP